MRITPNNITELKDNEIFVFGSNESGIHESGIHGAGAAKLAKEKFGAILGKGHGYKDNHMLYLLKDHMFNIF